MFIIFPLVCGSSADLTLLVFSMHRSVDGLILSPWAFLPFLWQGLNVKLSCRYVLGKRQFPQMEVCWKVC